MKEDIEEILISEERIRCKVEELGMQIAHDYQGKLAHYSASLTMMSASH